MSNICAFPGCRRRAVDHGACREHQLIPTSDQSYRDAGMFAGGSWHIESPAVQPNGHEPERLPLWRRWFWRKK